MTDARIATGALPVLAPLGLARSESALATPLSGTVSDLAGSIVTFEVPDDLDVWVTCRVPHLTTPRRGAAVILLTDGDGRVVDSVAVGGGRRGQLGFVTVNELIPAGSGVVTRKLRGCTSRGRAVANRDGAGTVTIDAYVR